MKKIYKFQSNNNWGGDINDSRLSLVSNNIEKMEEVKKQILYESRLEYPHGHVEIVPVHGALVIMNENHSILPEQHTILYEKYGEYSILKVPAEGWTLEEMEDIISSIQNTASRSNIIEVIFISPIPYMIMELTRRELISSSAEYCENTGIFTRIFHNDKREKKELPNGKIIQVVAKEGWQLV